MLRILLVAVICGISCSTAYEVVYAVNAGGKGFIDSNKIRYQADLGNKRTGIVSDYGLQLAIQRAPAEDVYLYQTERYHTETFHYDVPIAGDGQYALVLKFAEVYFEAAGMKVFNVVLNSIHRIIHDLDIFGTVGKGVAYDETTYFTISENKLYCGNEMSHIADGARSIRVDFVKTTADNPKINAIVLFKGNDLNELPLLPDLDDADTKEVYSMPNLMNGAKPVISKPLIKVNAAPEKPRKRTVSGPKHSDPYEFDTIGVFLPAVMVVTMFIPLVSWLCQL